MSISKRILISGASTGIGKACAEALADAGHQVYAGIRKLGIEFNSKKIVSVILDVSSESSISSVLSELSGKKNAGIDILINNAGLAVGGPLEAVGLAQLKNQFDVNVFGLYELTRQFLPMLRKSAHAKIINVSSVSGLFATQFMGPYCSSKFAVEAMSDSWRRELRKFGISVVLLEPGAIDTPIWEKSIAAAPKVDHPECLNLYLPESSDFQRYVQKEAEAAMSVSRVSDLVLKIVDTSRPKARYMINGSKLMLKTMSILPEAWVDSFVSSGIARRR